MNTGETCLKLKFFTLIFLTRLAVELATSLAAWTKCLLATGLLVLLEATLQTLHRMLVCLAITVAAASTYSVYECALNRINPCTKF